MSSSSSQPPPRKIQRTTTSGQGGGRRRGRQGPSRPSILLLGDSLTQLGFGSDPYGTTGKNASSYPAIGWASLLAVSYSRRADIINRGFRGYTSSMLLQILPQILEDFVGVDHNNETTTPPQSIPLVTIWVGANDYVRGAGPTDNNNDKEYVPSISDQRHVPTKQYRQNLMDIVALVRRRLSRPKILLFTLPPLHQSKFEDYTRSLHPDGKLRSLRKNRFAKEYGDIVKEVAKECGEGCSVVDVYNLLNGDAADENDFSKYLIDGLHLTQEGNAKVYEGIMELLQKEHPQLSPIATTTTNSPEAEKGNASLVPLEYPQWQDLMKK